VTREELDGIVELWIDAALRLTDRDLKMMNRLVRAQMRRMDHGSAAEATPFVEATPFAEPLAAA
jgi:DSF synthase